MTELDGALESTLAILAKVQPADLDAPTPCASWNVRALINHFIGTARWWAAALDGHLDDTEADYAAGDFVAAYQESGRIARAAFAARARRTGWSGCHSAALAPPCGVWQRSISSPTAGSGPCAGHPADLDPELAEQLLGQARMAITDDSRGPDGLAPFGPEAQAPAGAGVADQLAAFLGRPV